MFWCERRMVQVQCRRCGIGGTEYAFGHWPELALELLAKALQTGLSLQMPQVDSAMGPLLGEACPSAALANGTAQR